MSGVLNPALTEIVDDLIKQQDGLGLKILTTTGGTTAAITTTDDRVVAFVNAGGNGYDGRFLWAPTSVAADQARAFDSTASVTTGVATLPLLGPALGGAIGTGTVVYILAVEPSVLIGLINDALREEYYETTEPLSLVPDPGFNLDVSNWAAHVGTTAISSIATAARVFDGKKSGRVLNGGANGYADLASALLIPTNSQLIVAAISQNAVGTTRLRAVDGSGNTIATADHTESAWQYQWLSFTPGSTVESINIRLMGVGAADDSYWSDVWVQMPQDNRMFLPSYANARAKIKQISRSQFKGGANGTSGNVRAFSRTLERLNPARDFRYTAQDQDANPYEVELSDGLLQYPLWVTYLRPFADVETLSAGTDTTKCPLAQIGPRSLQLVGERWGDTFPEAVKLGELYLNRRLVMRTKDRPRKSQYQVRRVG